MKRDCECGNGCCEDLNVKILGSGCRNCVTLANNTDQALKELGLQAKVNKVTDLAEIMSYGVMSTPALVINEEVVSYGKVLRTEEIAKILEQKR
jgi:small redox-active disulfide protein 2